MAKPRDRKPPFDENAVYSGPTEFDERVKNPLYPVDSPKMRAQIRAIDAKIFSKDTPDLTPKEIESALHRIVDIMIPVSPARRG